jgi:hypothetical protein
MITAGHCYGLGASVLTPTGTYVGRVRFQAPYPSRDFEFYGYESHGGRIYLGKTLPGTEGYEVGAHDPMVGDAICTGGGLRRWPQDGRDQGGVVGKAARERAPYRAATGEGGNDEARDSDPKPAELEAKLARGLSRNRAGWR